MRAVTPARVLYEDPAFLVVDKRAGIPTVQSKSDTSLGTSMLNALATDYPEILSVGGRASVEGGVLYRLDTPTRGLVIIARNSEAYQRLQAIMQANLLVREYAAISSTEQSIGVLEDFPPYPYEDPLLCGGRVVSIGSLFRYHGKNRSSVRPVLSDSPRHVLERSSPTWHLTRVLYNGVTEEGSHRFICRLNHSFRHQVRAHLGWSGWPVAGDRRYGGSEREELALTAVAVEFPHPFTSERIEVRVHE
ncbi:MAG TPA: pseudouridine synthase [Sphaerochaeta sp.]|nr:pseudouridine synthase [Sphaerochaeta sp.]